MTTTLESKIIEIMTAAACDYNRRDLWCTIRFIKDMPAIRHLYENASVQEVFALVDRLADE